ncbi:thioredoxin-like domain-containing protein [Pedobacter sp. UC225_61]|uniref:thioredoxin-like domain-containing protein n=1 Tax=Pedobacter sp. UC225_61 TaxID=3374623 RepID=UPI0037B03588
MNYKTSTKKYRAIYFRIKVMITLMVVITLIFPAFLANAQGYIPFRLQGKVPLGYEGHTIYLRLNDYYSSNQFSKLDSFKITKSNFEFAGVLGKPAELADLFITGKKGRIKFFKQLIVDSGLREFKIKSIDTNYHFRSTWCMKDASEVTYESPTTALLDSQFRLTAEFYCKFAFRQPGVTEPSLDSKKQDELDLLKIALIKNNPNNYFSLIFLRQQLNSSVMADNELLQIFSSFSEALQAGKLGKEIKSLLEVRIKAENATLIGKTVPEFTIHTPSGKTFRNSSLKGEPYLMVFSATWCGPCQKELPFLKEIYTKYNPKGLKVIYFNLDDNLSLWKSHIKKNNLTWINVSEGTKFRDSKIANQFHVYSIPTCFLIDKSGKIVYNADQMDRTLVNLEKYIIAVL